MEERKSITKNILENNEYQIPEEEFTDEYYLKKLPVFQLLAKILYLVLIIIFFLYGAYFLALSNSDIYAKDFNEFDSKSKEWNQTYLPDFYKWKISIKNEIKQSIEFVKDDTKMHEFDDTVNIFYQPLQFTTSNFSELLADIKLNKRKKFDEYNLTSNFYLELNDGIKDHTILLNNISIFVKTSLVNIKKSSCIKSKNLWIDEEEKCYRFFLLRSLCLIIDQDTKKLFVDYKKFKCNGYNDWYESYGVFQWVIDSYDPSYDDISSLSKSINVYVSSNKDPYVFAQYNGSLHFSNEANSYGTAGIWLIATSLTLVLVPMIIILKNKKQKEFSEILEVKDLQFGVPNNSKSVQSSYFIHSGDQSKIELNDLNQTKHESIINASKRI